MVAYFHGGGWVLGGADSDDPFCRDLCLRSDAIVVSVGYRHAPEHRFPAPVLDGFAAVKWMAGNAAGLGAHAGRLAVCGWSAGGNIAAVVCQMARDAAGPPISGQVLVNPVTDGLLTDRSAAENAEGYGLTTALMHWFWNHYADPADRIDPKAAPLRAGNLSPRAAGVDRHQRIRSAARSGCRLRGCLVGGWRPRPTPGLPWPNPHLAHRGGHHSFRHGGARRNRRRLAQIPGGAALNCRKI